MNIYSFTARQLNLILVLNLIKLKHCGGDECFALCLLSILSSFGRSWVDVFFSTLAHLAHR